MPEIQIHDDPQNVQTHEVQEWRGEGVAGEGALGLLAAGRPDEFGSCYQGFQVASLLSALVRLILLTIIVLDLLRVWLALIGRVGNARQLAAKI